MKATAPVPRWWRRLHMQLALVVVLGLLPAKGRDKATHLAALAAAMTLFLKEI